MNIFISWSGPTSKAVAEALRDWLKLVIQALDPWISPDIDKGARWSPALAAQLEKAKAGIICLTPDNLEAPWILFEAGALSKTLENTYVCPYLFRVEPANLKGPLAQFQSTRAEKEETRKLMQTVNRALKEDALSEPLLNKAFDQWWPDLESALAKVPQPAGQAVPHRPDREILEEILALVREQARAREAQVAEDRRRQAFDDVLASVKGVNILPPTRSEDAWRRVADYVEKIRNLTAASFPAKSASTLLAVSEVNPAKPKSSAPRAPQGLPAPPGKGRKPG